MDSESLVGTWVDRDLMLKLNADGTWHQRYRFGPKGLSWYLHGRYTLSENTLEFTTDCKSHIFPERARERKACSSSIAIKVLRLSGSKLILASERPRPTNHRFRRLPPRRKLPPPSAAGKALSGYRSLRRQWRRVLDVKSAQEIASFIEEVVQSAAGDATKAAFLGLAYRELGDEEQADRWSGRLKEIMAALENDGNNV